VLGKRGPQKHSEQRTSEHADEHYATYGNGAHDLIRNKAAVAMGYASFVMPDLDGSRKAITHGLGADCL
jgi:hypothetical protein